MTSEKRFEEVSKAIASHIERIFARGDGWLNAATDLGRQMDVWGTLYAMHLGLIDRKIDPKDIVHLAAVKHSTTPWPKVIPGVAPGRYQNGAYWHTATGWLISAVARSEEDMASRIAREYIDHLRADDFRKGEKFGAPWECLGPDRNVYQNPVYMASVTVPLAVLSQYENHPHHRSDVRDLLRHRQPAQAAGKIHRVRDHLKAFD
jgi:hypothetical protein